jgi:hypothetical protein
VKAAVLPAWMYGDPCAVVERIELQAIAKARREAAKKRAHEAGLSASTIRHMRRLRIQELAANAMKAKP